MEATVTKIMRPPYEENGKWYVPVQYSTDSNPFNITRIPCATQEETELVVAGSKFQIP